MKNLKMVDITLRECAGSSELSLSFKEKIEIVKQLERLNLDVIEVAPIVDEKADTLFLHTAALLLKNSVLSCATGLSSAEVERAWNAVSGAKKARLHIIVPVSSVKMEFECHKKPAAMLKLIEELVSTAHGLTPDVEFTAQDATRADSAFLYTAIKAAITAGARIINLSDTAGTMLPGELAAFVKEVIENVPELKDVRLSVQCSDEMSMATACAFACAREGVTQIKTTITQGVSAPLLETVAHTLRLRGDSLGYSCRLKVTEMQKVLSKLHMITNTKKSATSPFDSGVEDHADDTEILDNSADITAVGKFAKKMGYDISKEDLAKVFEAFTRIVRKKDVGRKELDAIIASAALQVAPTYKIISYVINSGNCITPTAHITLEKDGKQLQGFTVGDGPIDAAFLAVEQIIGHHYELDDYQIMSVTEGREAMADALIKLRSGGKLYSGRGISTDVIGASIRAYINALNKIVFDEMKG